MGNKQEYVALFPKGLDHLNDDYEQFKAQVYAIDYELENAPKDQGPNPKNRPSGPEGFDAGMRDRRKKYLDSNREKRVKGYRSTIEKSIGALEDKEQSTILSRYDYETSKNGLKNHSKEELKSFKSIDKEDNASFDYMAATHFSKYHQPEIAKADEKENIEAWSDRYMDMIESYRSRSPDIDMSKNLDEPELEPQ